MKTTLRIARNELGTLFYSPIAWFLLVIFLFQYGFLYTSYMGHDVQTQELGGFLLRFMANLTSRTFGDPRNGLFSDVLNKIFLYLPLLTMGLMSRETASGTIKLLYSSPIRIRQIIFGKFLAMMVYSLLLVLVLTIFVICGLFNIRFADGGPLFAGLLGIFLMLCTYSAIGLFMSCLTTYQVVAALSTLVMLAALTYVGTLWQDVDFVRDLTWFLSINGRAAHMMLGLITTKDILYFVLICAVFLGFSIYKLKGERETKPWLVKAGRYVGIVASALLVGYVFSRPGLVGYLDTTATKSQTLTVNTQRIVKEMGDGTLEVTSYINLLDKYYRTGMPSMRNADMARWEPYLRFKPDIKFRYVYYYDSSNSPGMYQSGLSLKELAEKYIKTYKEDSDMFETPEQIRKEIDLRPEENRYVMQLKYKGKTTFLRLFDDMQVFPSETETSAALQRLLLPQMPKIAFVEGELERNINQTGDRQYKTLTNTIAFRNSLINQGFDVETISLHDRDIPGDIAGLVIADPKVSFDTSVLAKIRKYVVDGGNLLIAGEPGKQALLNPILQPLGVHLMDGMLIQQSKDLSPDLIQSLLTPAAKRLSKSLVQAAADSLCVSLTGAVGLTYDSSGSFTIEPLLMTDGKVSWSKKKKFDPEMIESIESPFADQGGGSGMMTGGGSVISAGGMLSAGAPMPVMAAGTSQPAGLKPAGKAADGVKPGQPMAMERPMEGQPMAGRQLKGNLRPMDEKTKKRMDSLRDVVHSIMTGPGTADEKKEKIRAAFAASRGMAAAGSPATMTPLRVVNSEDFKKKMDSMRALRNASGATGGGAVTSGSSTGTTGTATLSSTPGGSGTISLSSAGGVRLNLDSLRAAHHVSGTGMAASTGMLTPASAAGTPALAGVAGASTATGVTVAPAASGATTGQGVSVEPGGLKPAGIHRVGPGKPVVHQQAAVQGDQSAAPVDLAYSAADGDVRGSLPAALSLTRRINGKEQRIVVVGDADFLSNTELTRRNVKTCNFDFATSVFGWFTYGQFPVDSSRPATKDNRVTLTDGGLKLLKIVLLGILPGLILLMAAIVLIRRKRK